MNEFCLGFHWSLFPRFKLTIFKHWFRWWLGADQATSHYLNQWWLIYWCIYVSLGLNELTDLIDIWIKTQFLFKKMHFENVSKMSVILFTPQSVKYMYSDSFVVIWINNAWPESDSKLIHFMSQQESIFWCREHQGSFCEHAQPMRDDVTM